MARVKRGETARKRKKKIFEIAKGYRGSKKNHYRQAVEQVEKGLQYAYRDRRNKKRNFRSLWITRINSAARKEGLSYNNLMNGLKKANVNLNRKMLADLVVNDPIAFKQIVEIAKQFQG